MWYHYISLHLEIRIIILLLLFQYLDLTFFYAQIIHIADLSELKVYYFPNIQ